MINKNERHKEQENVALGCSTRTQVMIMEKDLQIFAYDARVFVSLTRR